MSTTAIARYTFVEFVVGRSNEAAYTASSAAAVAPGTLYNPILVTGATGLGKTHLAHAVASETVSRDGRSARIITADAFLELIASAMATGTITATVEELAQCTVLVMDDVHIFHRNGAAQDALVSLAAYAVALGTQLMLTTDRDDDASALTSRLVAQFRTGHVATLENPDWAHRVAILKAKVRAAGVGLPPDVVHYLASQSTGSVRELEGQLTRLMAIAALEQTPISLALAQRAVPTRRPADGEGTFGALFIQQAVAAEWGISPDALTGAGRSQALNEPRRVAMLLCRDRLELSLREIGAAFGGRDVSTVVAALRRARAEVADDERLSTRVEHVSELLAQSVELAV